MKSVESSKIYRFFYPTVPVIVASTHGDGVSAMPVVSAISLSNNPPRVGFSSLSTHSTYRVLSASRCFSMQWLDRRFVKAVELLGSTSGQGVEDKLNSAGLKHHRGMVLNVPVVDGASGVLECALAGVSNFGDHDLVIGDVKASYAAPDFREYWKFKAYRPILYAGSPDRFRTYRG